MRSRLFLALSIVFASCTFNHDRNLVSEPVQLSLKPILLKTLGIESDGVKKITLELTSSEGNAYLSLVSNKRVLIDFLPVPDSGVQVSTQLVRFDSSGSFEIRAIRQGGNLTINRVQVEDYHGPALPQFVDASAELGFDTEYTWKYGGPSIGDINNDGYYDMVLNNHDKVPTILYWNRAGNKLEKHAKPLRPWDVHGTAIGDYDADGDLDVVIAQGGGNGTNPQPAHLLRNDNNKDFVRVSDSVGITIGARGRSARWIDMDLDNDLDLLLINAAGIYDTDESKNNAFRNNGDGTFTLTPSPGIDMAIGERLHITDFNNDGVDDIILYFPLSLWQGNGDFTFSNVSERWLPEGLLDLDLVTGAAAVDIDNDADIDIYLSRGKPYYEMALKNIDLDSIQGRVDLREEGNKGRRGMNFIAAKEIVLDDFFYWYRLYDDGFPLFLGRDKNQVERFDTAQITVSSDMAMGFPNEVSENGWYLGYLGDNVWRLEWNKNANIYWGIRVSIHGVQQVMPDFTPQNRNVQDVLLRNEGDRFIDITASSEIPKGNNAQGVISGDFNNDGLNDFYVFRFGKLTSRVTDWLLLNQDKMFLATQDHGARDENDPGHGDMGAAFDLNQDGSIDLLSGSDNPGKWYMYNQQQAQGNYVLVEVGLSPKANVDPYSATVDVYVAGARYHKKVGSHGAVHSQSLLNNLHFGLGVTTKIDSVRVTWRNDESYVLREIDSNQSLLIGSRQPNLTE